MAYHILSLWNDIILCCFFIMIGLTLLLYLVRISYILPYVNNLLNRLVLLAFTRLKAGRHWLICLVEKPASAKLMRHALLVRKMMIVPW